MFFVLVLDVYGDVPESVLIFFEGFINLKESFFDSILKELFQMVFEDDLHILKLSQQLIVLFLYSQDLKLFMFEFLLKISSFFLLNFERFLELVDDQSGVWSSGM
jgi:hypothetical protein